MAGGKSGEHERQTAKFLTRWYSGKTRPYLFWKTPSSGGLGTISELNYDLYGDVYPIDADIKKWWPWTIECKTGYDDASFDKHLKYNKSDPIKLFWEQVIRDSRMANRYPMLIFQKKGMTPQWVGVDYFSIDILTVYLTDIRRVSLKWSMDEELPEVHFFGLNEFFDKVSPSVAMEKFNIIL